MRADRGPARHFRGRVKELNDIRGWLASCRRKGTGTIILVQGPPGAGKTALLDVVSKEAKLGGAWEPVDISPVSLYDPQDMYECVYGEDYPAGTSYAGTDFAGAEVGFPPLKGRLTSHYEHRAERMGPTVTKILKDFVRASRKGVLLVLDEVQTMAADLADAKLKARIKNTLVPLQTGTLRMPVVLLAGGLNHSLDVLEDAGVSRIMGNGCLHRIGRLKPHEGRSVIRAWLAEDGQANDAPPDHIEAWVEKIAAETDGWPQHIHAYTPWAVEWLQAHGGAMPSTVPDEVLQKGREQRIAYYRQRSSRTPHHFRRVLARMVRDVPEDAELDRECVIDAFESVTKPAARPARQVAEEAFDTLVRKGMLSPADHGFVFPIPSMMQWLVDNYGSSRHGR